MYYLPDVVQPKVPTLLARISYPLLFDRNISEGDVRVQLAVNRLPHFLEEVAGFVQNEKFVVGILAWLHLRVVSFSWSTLLASLLWPWYCSVWYCSVKALHVACPYPAPSFSHLPSSF